MTRGGRLGVGVLGLVAIGLVVAWFLHAFERREEEVPLPPKGEALWNPLYAAKLALQADGQRVVSQRRLAEAYSLGRRDTVVLLGDTASMPARVSDDLMAFVEGGGHLVAAAPLERSGPLVDAFDLARVVDAEAGCVRLEPKPETRAEKRMQATLSGLFDGAAVPGKDDIRRSEPFCIQRFTLGKDQAPSVAWGDGSGYVLVRLPYGDGSVDIVSDLQFAQNRSLELDANHGALLRELLAPNWNAGTIHLVASADMPPWWRLLFDNAWRAVVALLLFVAAWLWMRMQRFGPRLPAPPAERRALLEHVQASGEHLYRYGRAHLLHTALRERVLARLRRRDPIAAALDGPGRDAAIAARTGLDLQLVADALQTPRPFDAKDFRHRISALITLGRRL